METAVLLVHYLHQLNMPRILVKVVNDEQTEIMKLVGATDTVQPDQDATHNAAMLIHHPRAVEFLELGGGQLIVTARPPTSLVGKPAQATPWLDRFGISLVAVWEPGQPGPPTAPPPGRLVAETDLLLLAGPLERLRELRKLR